MGFTLEQLHTEIYISHITLLTQSGSGFAYHCLQITQQLVVKFGFFMNARHLQKNCGTTVCVLFIALKYQ